jgi:hypothetical protein
MRDGGALDILSFPVSRHGLTQTSAGASTCTFPLVVVSFLATEIGTVCSVVVTNSF